MDKYKNLSESVIFPKGQKITNDYFIGATWLEMLVSNDTIYNCPIGNVTFAPGARNNWLAHIAISTNAQRGDAEWLEPVTDEEYKQLGV
ncbi:MAG: hypothetical protein P4N59_05835 [Negativicutes bacterium]|nr:hypothetical protein [Negativicutes bacterium]